MEKGFSTAGSLYEPPVENGFPLKMTRATGGQAFIYHWHDAAELLLGLSGETTAGIADRPYRLGKGDILLIPPGESHCLFPSGAEDTRLVLMFEPKFFLGDGAYAGSREKLSSIPLHSDDWGEETKRQVRDLLYRLEQAFQPKAPGWQAETGVLSYCWRPFLPASLPERPPAAIPGRTIPCGRCWGIYRTTTWNR